MSWLFGGTTAAAQETTTTTFPASTETAIVKKENENESQQKTNDRLENDFLTLLTKMETEPLDVTQRLRLPIIEHIDARVNGTKRGHNLWLLTWNGHHQLYHAHLLTVQDIYRSKPHTDCKENQNTMFMLLDNVYYRYDMGRTVSWTADGSYIRHFRNFMPRLSFTYVDERDAIRSLIHPFIVLFHT